ncbi:XAC0095 family protein [Xanthomonas sacchari]
MPGYFLPEDSQFRLAKLRDHVRFLLRLAQPRTQAEERAAEPKVRMGELALCLEMLGRSGGSGTACAVLSSTADRHDVQRRAFCNRRGDARYT